MGIEHSQAGAQRRSPQDSSGGFKLREVVSMLAVKTDTLSTERTKGIVPKNL